MWSPEGKFLKEFIGPSAYGGGGQVDPRNPSRIYYGGMEFSLDYATAVDRQGNTLLNGNPLTALDAAGKVVWTYPNRFVGVHGTHHATEPRPGQLVGPLGIIGQEELPGVGEVFMLSSNSGEWYLFTADGLLAATVWHDLPRPASTPGSSEGRRGMSVDNVTLGGEHFGGSSSSPTMASITWWPDTITAASSS